MSLVKASSWDHTRTTDKRLEPISFLLAAHLMLIISCVNHHQFTICWPKDLPRCGGTSSESWDAADGRQLSSTGSRTQAEVLPLLKAKRKRFWPHFPGGSGPVADAANETSRIEAGRSDKPETSFVINVLPSGSDYSMITVSKQPDWNKPVMRSTVFGPTSLRARPARVYHSDFTRDKQ